MPRPVKCRKVSFVPSHTYFKPDDLSKPDEYKLKLEELEAIRLKDIEKLSQEEAAVKMQVSRQTFQNIIEEARYKVAVALVEGKGIRIGGGDYKIHDCKIKCNHCGHQYHLENTRDRFQCPVCHSDDVVCSTKGKRCRPECIS